MFGNMGLKTLNGKEEALELKEYNLNEIVIENLLQAVKR